MFILLVFLQVLLSNKGLIDASFKFSRPNTFYGRCFSFNPEGGVIPFGSSMTVRVTFQSHTLGTFSEDLLLTVEGQPELLTLTFRWPSAQSLLVDLSERIFFFSWLMVVSCPIRGCVVGPTFHFDVLELNFGDVAFGELDFFCFAFYMSHCNTVWHHKESQRISISTVVQLCLKNLNYYFF